jgi:hypothetical protein
MWVPPSARQYDFVRLFLRFHCLVSPLKQRFGNSQETLEKRVDERKKSNARAGLTRVGTAVNARN